jgi:hypothetical protein
MPVHRKREEVAQIIEDFLNGTGGRWDWDDFCSSPIDDPALDAVRMRCVDIRDEDPDPVHYCGADGIEALRGLVSSLRVA